MNTKETFFAGYDEAVKLFEMALESGASAEQAVELIKECKIRVANAKE